MPLLKEVNPVLLPARLAGVDDKLDAIRNHVINSLAARQLGSERIAGMCIIVLLLCFAKTDLDPPRL